MPPRPPGFRLAALTRQAVAGHDRWDGPHQFILFRWEPPKAVTRCATYPIAPDTHPGDYLELMSRHTGTWIRRHPDDLPCAFLLLSEGHGVIAPDRDAGAAQRARFDADRRLRGFAARPDAVETCTAWTIDVTGRMWAATKMRGQDGISLTAYAAGDSRQHGQFISALRDVAAATAEIAARLAGEDDLR